MDIRGCVFVVILLINCVCISLISASESDRYSEVYPVKPSLTVAVYGNSLRGPMLEKKLREDIERELIDIRELENQLMGHLNLIHEKKRQLEIKKRQPVQCLVNIVSCWKRK